MSLKDNWKNFPIYLKDDGSYIIHIQEDTPYFVSINYPGFKTLHERIKAFATENPDKLLPEPKPTLEESKNLVKQELLEYRQKLEESGYMLNGQKWDSEQKDELRLNSAYKLFEELGITEYPGWKISKGVYVTLTKDLLKQASAAMMQHYGTLFAIEQTKIAQIDACATLEELEAWRENNLTTGWVIE